MKIRILALGKLKNRALKDLVEEYRKRLAPYFSVEILELKDESAPENLSEKQRAQILQREGRDVLSKIRPSDTCIVLAVEGKRMDSIAFSQTLYRFVEQARGDVIFIIGSSMGLSQDVKDRGDLLLSFSDMTMPHTLMRPVLMEQLYRAARIHAGHTYHK